MEIIFTTISIFIITLLIWLFNRVSPFRICPICAGVSGTWLWMLIGILTGNLQPITYNIIVAMLMGGSVVGIAYQLEKYLPLGRSPLFWKSTFIPVGFAAVYSLIVWKWIWFAVAFLLVLAITASFFIMGSNLLSNLLTSDVNRLNMGGEGGVDYEKRRLRREELEKKMKECC